MLCEQSGGWEQGAQQQTQPAASTGQEQAGVSGPIITAQTRTLQRPA